MLQYLVRFFMSMANLILLQYFLLSFKDVKIKTTNIGNQQQAREKECGFSNDKTR